LPCCYSSPFCSCFHCLECLQPHALHFILVSKYDPKFTALPVLPN
jgi:hypothetical protein